MNPEKEDWGALGLSKRQEDVIWLKFKDDYNVRDFSAETIASMFSAFGDFYVFKDSHKSVILHFYYFDGTHLESKSTEGFILHIQANMD